MTGTMLDLEDMRNELMFTYLNVSVALQIQGLRAKRGWSQEELARRAGLYQEQIVLIEQVRWKHMPTTDLLRKLAVAFDVRLSISFGSYGELVREFLASSEVRLPIEFNLDHVFSEVANLQRARVPGEHETLERTHENLA